MRKCIRSNLIILFSAMLFMLSSIIGVFADRSEVDAVVQLESGLGHVMSVCIQANSTCDKEILVYTSDDGLLSFSNKLYSELDMNQKKEYMEVALSAVQETDLGAQMKNKTYNFIANQDSTTSAAVKYLRGNASADFVTALDWLKPFTSPISTFLGITCLLVFMMIGVSALFDIAYLTLPGVQFILERGEENKKPFGVSREAWSSYKDCISDTKYRNILTLYFGRRAPIIIVGGVALLYVVSGYIYDALSYIIDAFAQIRF